MTACQRWMFENPMALRVFVVATGRRWNSDILCQFTKCFPLAKCLIAFCVLFIQWWTWTWLNSIRMKVWHAVTVGCINLSNLTRMQFENQLVFHNAVIIDQSMRLLKLHWTAVVSFLFSFLFSFPISCVFSCLPLQSETWITARTAALVEILK